MAVWSQFKGISCQKCPEAYKKVRGCREDVRPLTVREYTVTRCPMTFVGFNESAYLMAHREYKAGFLPNEGSWLDQPYKFTEIMSFLDSLIARMQEEERGNG